MASASTSVWEKTTPLPLTLMPNNSVLPCMSLTPFELPPQCLSSEPVCMRHCKGNTWDSRSLQLTQLQPLSVFTARNMGNSLPGTKTLSWGFWCEAEAPCSSGYTSVAKISLQIFNHHKWVWDQLVLHFHSYQSQHDHFFISLILELLFS